MDLDNTVNQTTSKIGQHSDIVEEAKKQIAMIDDGFDMDLGYTKHPLPIPEQVKSSPPTKTTMPDKLRETVDKVKSESRR